ncbi:MAG: tRNA lysidine(34) synthetase TilS [Nocardioidaceae bacterium]
MPAERESSHRLDPAVADVRRAVRTALADLEPGSSVVVACSGGADSMALAAATAFESKLGGWLVRAVVVDHAQQDESAATSALVASRLRAMGLGDVCVVRVEVSPEGSPEAAAREARYDALERAAGVDDAVVLLGHTRDDQAETVLLGLARGSGTRSLAGMAPQQGRYRRPLLDLGRAVTTRACNVLGIEVWEDPHNSDGRYTRVRVRRDALPALQEALGPGVVDALARTAAATRHDADALDALAAELYAQVGSGPGFSAGKLRVDALLEAPTALRRRALRLAALAAGSLAGELFAVHVDAVERLLTHWHGQAAINLPGRVSVVRRGDALCFRRGDLLR